ncbi:alpha/beta hydrolase [Lactobacillus johnsonii]|nr:alpha/beta hydrolase [Lactobacillus johnsonii]
MQYLVSGCNSTYRVLKINGKNAQYSKLHENSQVDKALIKFVWNK